MSDKTIPIFLSAGDPSGDIAGYHLIQELIIRNDNLSFLGLGGSRMKAAGQEQLIEGSRLAVLGFWEVARKFMFFKRLINQAAVQIEKIRPRAVILIDYPGFNLRLAKRIKPLGIPIIYYVSPQVWAWGGKRIHQIRRLVNLMLLILPFEKEIYDKASIKNQFVGHYLLDDMDNRFIRSPYNPDSDLILLMPGSRSQEVQRMLPTMLETAARLNRDNRWRFAIAAVEGEIDYNSYLNEIEFPVQLVKGGTRELIAESRLVITSSGTATLETGIIGRPMIVIYKTGTLTYLIARHLVTLDKIALVNITAREKIVPELIQNRAVPKAIAGEAKRMLENKTLCLDIVRRLNEICERLETTGASARAAEAIMEYISC
nr:lipid-A-disaccharide synthase [candidate division Zixibacteria bacterium]